MSSISKSVTLKKFYRYPARKRHAKDISACKEIGTGKTAVVQSFIPFRICVVAHVNTDTSWSLFVLENALWLILSIYENRWLIGIPGISWNNIYITLFRISCFCESCSFWIRLSTSLLCCKFSVNALGDIVWHCSHVGLGSLLTYWWRSTARYSDIYRYGFRIWIFVDKKKHLSFLFYFRCILWGSGLAPSSRQVIIWINDYTLHWSIKSWPDQVSMNEHIGSLLTYWWWLG